MAAERDAGEDRIAVFGGSFNPPHVGHVLAAVYLLSVCAVDRVLVVPVYRHAFGKELAPFEARLQMCRLAMEWIAGVEISAIEREIGGESRTLHTIEALLQRQPKRRLRLVIGADVLDDREQWHRFDRIAELAPPIVLGRVGFAHPEAPPAVLPEVSSSELRELIAAGEMGKTEMLLAATVREYIEANRLYREGDG